MIVWRKDVVQMENTKTDPNSPWKSDTILIVDDDAINRKILGKIFSEYYTIQEARDGWEGIMQIQENQNRFCAILLDVLMPKMNGIEVLHWLKKMGLLEKIPTILITSEAVESVMQQAGDFLCGAAAGPVYY